ncbi:alpha-hydroxy acid oxidase [Oceaniovalibus sp. ACAM 378]|uniref:alpha-hydroxy acid oxidase n=1 Tax=Oceaniovalibus sp. ACAM 378 TaxID=2599923 RepID=UPI0011D409C6|nr:alpha-hydroxy acid oxidase [Oceaniovalibus sp. ACAM 378]TYB89436.1 alpha-hydroxy-acid oxidizing protein [Oceaniovalibus sp. ACAM 378]
MFFDTTVHSSEDARRIARRRLPWMVFDYIDGAAGSGHGERLNRETLRAIRLQPRVLNGVEHRSIEMPLFGRTARLPFGVSPMGMCNLANPSADTLLAKFAAQHDVPVGVSTVASTSLEKMIELAEGNAWFQLYLSGARESSDGLINRAEAAGYDVLVLTVDVPEVGRRPRELRHGFTMPFRIGPRQFVDFACHPGWSLPQLLRGAPTMANFGGAFGEFDRTGSRAAANWAVLDAIRERWKGRLVVKGVLDPQDALRLKSAGVDAIQVSSHGGRQLDSAPAPILALRAIRTAVGPEFPLFYDSGIRSGEDIVKAYAMGADFVFLGRPFSFAIAAGGARGLAQLATLLAEETSITLAQLGLRDLGTVTADVMADTAQR